MLLYFQQSKALLALLALLLLLSIFHHGITISRIYSLSQGRSRGRDCRSNNNSFCHHNKGRYWKIVTIILLLLFLWNDATPSPFIPSGPSHSLAAVAVAVRWSLDILITSSKTLYFFGILFTSSSSSSSSSCGLLIRRGSYISNDCGVTSVVVACQPPAAAAHDLSSRFKRPRMDPLKNSNMRNITSVSNCNGCSVEEKRGKMPAGSELTSMARENDQYTSSGSHEECNQNIATTSVPATDLNDHPSSSSSSSSSSLHNKEYLKLLYKEAHGYNPSATTTTTTCQKSENYLDWDDYFISMAFLSALRSKDPHCQVGACIVNNDHRIIGIGYNGFPRDCADDIMPWNDIVENDNEQPASIDDKSKKKNDDFADGEVLAWLHTKHPYECHAEMNAILNKCSADVFNATMYVADFPCKWLSCLILVMLGNNLSIILVMIGNK